MPGAAEAVTGELDVSAALARRDEVIHDRDDSSQLPWLETRGIELVREHGRLDGERRVRAGDDVLVAERAVVVATGTGALIPPIEGLREARAMDQPRDHDRAGGARAGWHCSAPAWWAWRWPRPGAAWARR